MNRRIRINGQLYEAVGSKNRRRFNESSMAGKETYYGIGIRITYYDEKAVERLKARLEKNGHKIIPNEQLMSLGDLDWDRMAYKPETDKRAMEYMFHDFENSCYGDSEDGETLFVSEPFLYSFTASSEDEADKMLDDLDRNYKKFKVVDSMELGLSLSYSDDRWIDGEATDCGITVTPLD